MKANDTTDRTTRIVFGICIGVAFFQSIIISRGINAHALGMFLGGGGVMIIIAGIIGYIVDLVFKTKHGYWLGLVVALIYDAYAIMNIA